MQLNIGVPPKNTDFKPIPEDIYEVFVAGFETVPNKFYDPSKDKDDKKYQIKWTFKIREEGDFKGRLLSYYTGISIGRHPRNKLTNLVKITDPEFDIDVAYTDEDDFRNRNMNGVLRVTTTSNPYKDDEGNEKTFAKVTGVLPSKMGAMSATEILEDSLGATEERPF